MNKSQLGEEARLARLLPIHPGGKYCHWLVFLSAFSFYFFFVGRSLEFYHLSGDSLCQIAYWKILVRPQFIGSIGASVTKPGQSIVLGLIHESSSVLGDATLRIALSFFAASLVWILVRISTDVGGWWAGAITFFLSLSEYVRAVQIADSNLFLLPSLFGGLWLYYYRPAWKNLGRLLLVLSPLFRIESVAVVGLVAVDHGLRKEWKALLELLLCILISMIFLLSFVLRVQGSFSRFDSGSAAGYLNPAAARTNEQISANIHYVAQSIKGIVGNLNLEFRWLLVLVGLLGSFFLYKRYAYVLSAIIVLIANVLFLGGTFDYDRYCSTFYAFGISMGIGTIIRYSRHALRKTAGNISLLLAVSMVAIVALLYVPYELSQVSLSGGDWHYVKSAMALVDEPILPRGSRLMTEDDLLYPTVIKDPDRFSRLHALQHFNVLSDEARYGILAETDYIYIVKGEGHGYYYLNYMVNPRWRSDLFRVTVTRIIQTGKAAEIYGYWMIPLLNDENRVILKIVRAKD